jgi:2-furoyl-CoA dehydrogenase FAD binding subunit
VDVLASLIPGAHSVQKVGVHGFVADVSLGVGPVKGRYKASVDLFDLNPPHAVKLKGSARGALGSANGEGIIELVSTQTGTRLNYRYEAEIGGKVAAVGGRLLDAAARVVIRQFFEALARTHPGRVFSQLVQTSISETFMKPARFDYYNVETIDQVHKLIADNPDVRVIAGGQTLVPMLSMRLARPSAVVDIMRIDQLSKIDEKAGSIRVGAAVRQAALLAWPRLAEKQPLLAAALPWVGHAQTRNRGTICGSIAHADPSAELPLVLVALNGVVELSSRRGKRRVPAADFFVGPMTTARSDDEIIEAVLFPLRENGKGYAFNEFGRRHGDFAIVSCAAVADAKEVRLTVGGVADRPASIQIQAASDAEAALILNDFAWSLQARDDLHASAEYRRQLVRQMGLRTICEARQCIA